jgi:hypothetical protein
VIVINVHNVISVALSELLSELLEYFGFKM